MSAARTRITATALANEQLEIIRNLPYSEVGTVGGLPHGLIPATQNLNRDGQDFIVHTIIRSLDDPFDGQVGSSTNND